jgi:hypothetical protein
VILPDRQWQLANADVDSYPDARVRAQRGPIIAPVSVPASSGVVIPGGDAQPVVP